MPRTYKRREKPYKRQDPEKIKYAVQAVKNGIGIREVSRQFEISYSVLYRLFKNEGTIKKPGGQLVFSIEEEEQIVKYLLICAKWCYPLDLFDLRVILKSYLDKQGRKEKRFKNNWPGRDFEYAFSARHKDKLAKRMCQNIKRNRAGVHPTQVKEYFKNLEEELEGAPIENIINYDETCLTDDPGQKKSPCKTGMQVSREDNPVNLQRP